MYHWIGCFHHDFSSGKYIFHNILHWNSIQIYFSPFKWHSYPQSKTRQIDNDSTSIRRIRVESISKRCRSPFLYYLGCCIAMKLTPNSEHNLFTKFNHPEPRSLTRNNGRTPFVMSKRPMGAICKRLGSLANVYHYCQSLTTVGKFYIAIPQKPFILRINRIIYCNLLYLVNFQKWGNLVYI